MNVIRKTLVFFLCLGSTFGFTNEQNVEYLKKNTLDIDENKFTAPENTLYKNSLGFSVAPPIFWMQSLSIESRLLLSEKLFWSCSFGVLRAQVKSEHYTLYHDFPIVNNSLIRYSPQSKFYGGINFLYLFPGAVIGWQQNKHFSIELKTILYVPFCLSCSYYF